MKKILLLLITLASIAATAQQKELTKAETLAYIEKLYRNNYETPKNKITKFEMDGKVLVWEDGYGYKSRSDLSKDYKVSYNPVENLGRIVYIISYTDSGKETKIFYDIMAEADAKRLVKATEHLIKLLKSENSDPFGE